MKHCFFSAVMKLPVLSMPAARRLWRGRDALLLRRVRLPMANVLLYSTQGSSNDGLMEVLRIGNYGGDMCDFECYHCTPLSRFAGDVRPIFDFTHLVGLTCYPFVEDDPLQTSSVLQHVDYWAVPRVSKCHENDEPHGFCGLSSQHCSCRCRYGSSDPFVEDCASCPSFF
jgi:hypothetical protein